MTIPERPIPDPNAVDRVRRSFRYDLIPNHPDRKRAREELEEIEGFPHIKNPTQTLADYIDMGVGRVNIRIEEATDIVNQKLDSGEIEADDFTEMIEFILLDAGDREIWYVAGPPGSGKTFIRNLIKHSNPATSGLPIAEVSWEKDGLEAAREAGEIKTPRGQKVTPEELLKANDRFSKRVSLITRRSPYTVVEGPVDAVAEFDSDGNMLEPQVGEDGKLINVTGSPRGLKAFVGLINGNEDFQDFPPTRVSVVFMVGGYYIRNVLVYSRAEFAAINLKDPQALEKAAAIAVRYGKEPPKDLAELAIMQADGATPQLVQAIEEEYAQMAVKLWNRPDFELPTGLLKGLDEKTIVALMSNLRIRDSVRASQLEYMYNVLKPGNKVTRFVANNNPKASELGINIGEIKKHGSPEVKAALEKVERQVLEDTIGGIFYNDTLKP